MRLHTGVSMFSPSQGRCWQGRRTKLHGMCLEDEDAASGGSGRAERDEGRVVAH